MSTVLLHEFEARNDSIVQIDQFIFRQFIDVYFMVTHLICLISLATVHELAGYRVIRRSHFKV